jgi:hypothetical protein
VQARPGIYPLFSPALRVEALLLPAWETWKMSPAAWRPGSSEREKEFERPHPWVPTWLPASNARKAAPSTQN